MNKQQKKERMSAISERLRGIYPEALCALEYEGEPWRLLVMARLSAQCTDARVNIVSRELFRRFPTIEDMASAEISEIEDIVRPCGLYHTKAASIKAACADMIERFDGRVPDNMEDLLSLSGVGRKIANLLLGDIFGRGGVVADTHCIRIAGRLGFTPRDRRDPLAVERTLTPLLLEVGESAADFCHRIVLFGREVCTARAPQCATCPLSREGLCPEGSKNG